jgi:hypothetical protein
VALIPDVALSQNWSRMLEDDGPESAARSIQ